VSVLFPSMTKVTELDVSNCGLGATSMPGLAKLVSDATAALASVNFSGNGLTGASKEHGQWENIDLDLSGFVSLCTVLGKVTEVNLNDCGLGSASMPELAKIFSDPSAAVAHLNIAGELISPSVLYTRLPTILALLLTNCLITH
jgi:Ran GTPase-activating protein (RanGAP) involved in mRNA processing and transport